MTSTYNKLVRDKIPDLIKSKGGVPETTILDEQPFRTALREKLIEEVHECLADLSPQNLADIVEVIYALAKLQGVKPNELERLRAEKAALRGGFDNRIFLTSVHNPTRGKI